MRLTLIRKKPGILFIVFFLFLSSISLGISTDAIDDPEDLSILPPYEYHTYSSMTQLLQELLHNNSDIMSLTSLGTTYEGRDIWMVKLSENVGIDESEPGVLLMGAHHGNEQPSFEVLIYLIKYVTDRYHSENIDDDEDGLLNEDIIDGIDNDNDGMIDEDPSEDRIRDILQKTQIYVIPMVNPDGVDYGWRKNREPNYGSDGTGSEITSYGVDLNRNYGYRWNLPYLLPDQYYLEYLIDDSSWTYRGEAPFSERETQALRSFVETHNISISLSYHDYGEWMIFPWMHSSMRTPHESLFRSIGYNMSRINQYELRIYGQFGTKEYLIPRFCGTPGSSENWLYGEHGIIAYTIELCDHRPERDPRKVLDACWKHVGVNLYVCERSWTIDEEKKECTSLHIPSLYASMLEAFFQGKASIAP